MHCGVLHRLSRSFMSRPPCSFSPNLLDTSYVFHRRCLSNPKSKFGMRRNTLMWMHFVAISLKTSESLHGKAKFILPIPRKRIHFGESYDHVKRIILCTEICSQSFFVEFQWVRMQNGAKNRFWWGPCVNLLNWCIFSQPFHYIPRDQFRRCIMTLWWLERSEAKRNNCNERAKTYLWSDSTSQRKWAAKADIDECWCNNFMFFRIFSSLSNMWFNF